MSDNCTTSDNYYHPYYTKMLPTWQKMRDSVKSEEHIKQQAYGQVSSLLGECDKISQKKIPARFDYYLMPTEGMMTSKTGNNRYKCYLYRAKWYPYPLDTHDQSLGLINNAPAMVDLPSSLEYLINDATANQESLETVLNCVYSQQIIKSRVGVLAEVTDNPSEPFNMQIYYAESITDWRIAIDENGEEVVQWLKLLTDDCVNDKPVYLILGLDADGNYFQYQTTNEGVKFGDPVEDDGYIADSFVYPMVRESMSKVIPFVTINASRLGLNNIEKPWLESLTDSAFKLFQASATYEDNLFWGGQQTFCGTGLAEGEADKIKLGNGGRVASKNDTAKFYYASAGTAGIDPSEKNVNNLKADCVALGVDLINQGVESGTALETRMSVKTASLATLAKTGAEGLLAILKICVVWIGDSADDVIVVPNTEFADRIYTADDMQKFGALVGMGQMAQEDLYRIQKRQGLTSAETFEEWKMKLQDDVIVTSTVPEL